MSHCHTPSTSERKLYIFFSIAKIPDTLLNWITNYLEERGHKTRYDCKLSDVASITASVVQGSSLGPVSFLMYASDLHPLTPGNVMAKYEDDIYLIIPSKNTHTLPSEMLHVADLAGKNGLQLNTTKSLELLITKKQSSRSLCSPPSPIITRVTELNILWIILRQDFCMTSHIQGNQFIYALKTLKAHGLTGNNLRTVCYSN
jgi:Reverse transcriptase (RNA-dependent DNA polymerase)